MLINVGYEAIAGNSIGSDLYDLINPNVYNESSEGNAALPENPDDLLDDGYEETSHEAAKDKGHRTFENPETGDKVRHDKGKDGKSGHEGKDHYHRYNPDRTSRHDEYLDKCGNSCGRGSDESHLYPEKK